MNNILFRLIRKQSPWVALIALVSLVWMLTNPFNLVDSEIIRITSSIVTTIFLVVWTNRRSLSFLLYSLLDVVEPVENIKKGWFILYEPHWVNTATVIYGFKTRKEAATFREEQLKGNKKQTDGIDIYKWRGLEEVATCIFWDQHKGNGAYRPEWYSKEEYFNTKPNID